MPRTTLNWKKPTSRPRQRAGAISAMYMGPSTEEPPMPSPPTKRNNTSEFQPQAKPQPTAEMKYSTAISRSESRRPQRSPGMPANSEPITVPQSAAETDKPSDAGVSP